MDEENINNIIRKKLKDKTGLPEIQIALKCAGFNVSIQELIFKISEIE